MKSKFSLLENKTYDFLSHTQYLLSVYILFIYSSTSFEFTKMSSAFIVILTTVSYMIFGVTNYTNQISDFESASAAGLMTEAEKLIAIQEVVGSVKASQSLGLLIFMTLIPCALMLISNYLYQKNYKLDEAEYDRICKAIESAK